MTAPLTSASRQNPNASVIDDPKLTAGVNSEHSTAELVKRLNDAAELRGDSWALASMLRAAASTITELVEDNRQWREGQIETQRMAGDFKADAERAEKEREEGMVRAIDAGMRLEDAEAELSEAKKLLREAEAVMVEVDPAKGDNWRIYAKVIDRICAFLKGSIEATTSTAPPEMGAVTAGVCERCGGSRQVPRPLRWSIPGMETCPSCGGSGLQNAMFSKPTEER